MLNYCKIATILGRHKEAVAHARRAVALAPGHSMLRRLLANSLLSKQDFEEAADEYRRLLAGNPADLDARQGLATALSQLGRTDEAQAELRNNLLHPTGPADRQ